MHGPCHQGQERHPPQHQIQPLLRWFQQNGAAVPRHHPDVSLALTSTRFDLFTNLPPHLNAQCIAALGDGQAGACWTAQLCPNLADLRLLCGDEGCRSWQRAAEQKP
ncbi:7TM GPCR domain containing protein [Deinococcus grandis]|uniref:7TM GPCR domain containing protein n=1 Tax=Deinococcus grandis TaxID=57498 RepID=A0A117DS27_9DEIO|nr:hypothetical protein DEGR_37880 [Deinococcus grandis]GAQ23670.1 7TM GPCR domain containing protein [Deinococcus grandis]